MSMTTELEVLNRSKAERERLAHDHACHRGGKMNVIIKGPPLHEPQVRIYQNARELVKAENIRQRKRLGMS